MIACCRPLLLALPLALLPLRPWAADRTVALRASPRIASEIDATPRIADPRDEAERRINQALQRLDGVARKAWTECREQVGGGRTASWERTVKTPMRGPGFLSVVVTESAYCGGAYPNNGTWTVVYDLRTGRPVDWKALLLPALTGRLSLATAQDGTRTVQLASPQLWELYRTGWTRQDPQRAADAECKRVIEDAAQGGPPGLAAWPDAEQGGLVLLLDDLLHAAQACGGTVLVPLATLRQEGASTDLLRALAAARGR